MSSSSFKAGGGQVAALHLQPSQPGAPLVLMNAVEVVSQKGIADEPRYFGRVSPSAGRRSRQQITLIGHKEIAAHAATLGGHNLSPGVVRANIETRGINLVPLGGRRIEIGDTIQVLDERTESRKPEQGS